MATSINNPGIGGLGGDSDRQIRMNPGRNIDLLNLKEADHSTNLANPNSVGGAII